MAMDDIEDRIINEVESNTGDNFSPEPSNGGNDGGGSNSSAEPTTSAEPNRREEASQRSQRENREVPKRNQQRGTEKDKQHQQRDGTFRDEKGNLVDREGNLVAARGKERRIEQQNIKLRENNQNLMSEIAQLRQQAEQNNSLRGMPQQLGLNQQDMVDAMKIAGQMKQNPVVGARLALEYALSQGADLTSIISAEGLKDLGMGAQRKMMQEFHDKHFGPQQRERETQQVMERARQNATRFQAEYGEFAEHFDDVAKMIPEIMKKAEREGRHVDEYSAAEMGLQMLQNYAMQNGLDPRRSINDQIEELAQRGGNQQRRDVRGNQPRRQAPMPNGSRGGANQIRGRSGSMGPNVSSDAIVRQAMIDNGFSFG